MPFCGIILFVECGKRGFYMKLSIRTEKLQKVRENGFIPGVIYGRGIESTMVQVPYMEFKSALRKYGYTKTFNVELEGKKHVAYIKDAQLAYLQQHDYMHFDLVKVAAGDTMQASVSLHFINRENLPASLVFATILDELPVEYMVGSGVAYIEVDVSSLTADKPLYVKDITLPEGIKAVADPDQMVCSLQQASSEEAKEPVADEESDELDVVTEVTTEEE
jgi:large subunit ribosomal protein L25